MRSLGVLLRRDLLDVLKAGLEGKRITTESRGKPHATWHDENATQMNTATANLVHINATTAFVDANDINTATTGKDMTNVG